jgi:flagellar motor switch protein FliG
MAYSTLPIAGINLDSIPAVKVQDAERRQREIIAVARSLEAKGDLSLERKPVLAQVRPE